MNVNINQVGRIHFNMQVFFHHHHEVNIIQAIQFQGGFEIGRRNNFGPAPLQTLPEENH